MCCLSQCPQITDDLKAVGCRATWRVKDDDVQLATNQIASKRLQLDEALSAIHGVQFFFSCVSSVCSNAKEAKRSNKTQEEPPIEEKTYPAIGYFVVYRKTETCNENALFAALHNQDVEPKIRTIRTRARTSANRVMEKAARELFQVLKDHNNPRIEEMVNMSNTYCYDESVMKSSDEDDDMQLPSQPTHFPTTPCRLVVVNQHEFNDKLHTATAILQTDGLLVEIDPTTNVSLEKPCFSSQNEVAATITKIERVMKLCDHALCRSHVYAKPPEAKMTYLKMMDVKSYLHKLLSNEATRNQVLRHFQVLEKILSHPACEIIEQIKFDLDLIEVSNGFCFSISSRTFITCPIPESKRGTLSPRTFLPYDCTTPPQPQFFREGILNSFQDTAVRVNFLNKMYQCLMPSKMPHKVRKLVVAGPKDSGKTSWASIFHRIIPPAFIASITNERQFSAAMINDETQLVLVDEWSDRTLQSDLAKTIFQGGWLVTAVKHEAPRCVMNNSPFYITTNHVPNFGKEDENVKRRIAVFNTTSLPQTLPGVDRWIFDHAMDCVAWMAEEINLNHHHIQSHELWYEPGNPRDVTIESHQAVELFEGSKMRQITKADLEETTCPPEHPDPIHRSFFAESMCRRFARKRRANRAMPCSYNDVDEAYECESPGFDVSLESSGDDNVNPDNDPFSLNLIEPFRINPNREQACSSLEVTTEPHASSGDWDETEEDRPAEQTAQPTLSTDGTHEASSGCSLNSEIYCVKVAQLIQSKFDKNVTSVHALSFIERKRKALLKRDEKEKAFWIEADPSIDAWMLVLGLRRDVFDLKNFVSKHPDILMHLERLREVVKVLVPPCCCPVVKALGECRREGERPEQNEEEESEEVHDVDSQGLERRPQLSSQSYWTKVKGWRPW